MKSADPDTKTNQPTADVAKKKKGLLPAISNRLRRGQARKKPSPNAQAATPAVNAGVSMAPPQMPPTPTAGGMTNTGNLSPGAGPAGGMQPIKPLNMGMAGQVRQPWQGGMPGGNMAPSPMPAPPPIRPTPPPMLPPQQNAIPLGTNAGPAPQMNGFNQAPSQGMAGIMRQPWQGNLGGR